MKKKVVIGVGLVVLVAFGLFVVKDRSKVGTPSVESQIGIMDVVDSDNQTDSLIATRRQSVAPPAQAVEFAALHDAGKPDWTQEELSEAVQMLLGLNGEVHDYPELLQAIGMLNGKLSIADVAALREMLTFSNDRFPERMREMEINSIKNDVLDRLLRQAELSEGLGFQMAEMAADSSHDSVWRDYCVQFVAPFYERRSQECSSVGQAEASVSEELGVIHDAMFSALGERSETIAGTALIGLELLSRTHEEFDREVILGKALDIAGDESASAVSRMTALRLAAMTEVRDEVVDIARVLAQTGETVLLRSAAIVTLGEIGEAEDRELINAFKLEEDRQIAGAAKMALAKLDERVVL